MAIKKKGIRQLIPSIGTSIIKLGEPKPRRPKLKRDPLPKGAGTGKATFRK